MEWSSFDRNYRIDYTVVGGQQRPAGKGFPMSRVTTIVGGGIKSGEPAHILGLRGVYRLLVLIHRSLIPAPAKDGSGQYVWGEDDLARAREALLIDRRRRESRNDQPAACGA
jgi:hypothetical protein